MRKFLLSAFVVLCALFILQYIVGKQLFADQSQNTTVSATVQPRQSDFQFSFSSLDTQQTNINENTTLSYQINYGANQSAGLTTTTTLIADFSQDTQGGIDVLDYVIGSATNAYGNTAPIVDLNHRTITWTFSLPQGTTNQTVEFKLKTNANYTGTSAGPFTIKAKMSNQYISMPDLTISQSYLYGNISPTATPTFSPTNTPTPGPTNSPTPGPSATPTPQQAITPTTSPIPPPVLPFTFLDVSLVGLTGNAASVSFIANQSGNTSISYGTSPIALTQKQTLITPGFGTFNLASLTPLTPYYFQLQSIGQNGTATSEVFSFTTPGISQVPEVITNSLVVTSSTDIIYSESLIKNSGENSMNQLQTPIIPIAPATDYILGFKITKTEGIKSVILLLQNTSVLGISTEKAYAQNFPSLFYKFQTVGKGDGVYEADIANHLLPGIYSASIQVTDLQGNITTKQVADIHILKPFRVYDKVTKQPIEDVQITLFKYDEVAKTYKRIPQRNGLKNPIFTDSLGEASEQLASGKYKATFTLFLGYEHLEAYFDEGISQNSDFPTVYLKRAPITPLSTFMYYRNAFLDWLDATATYIAAIHESNRFFDLFALIVIFCTTIITLLLFTIRTHIRFSHLPLFFHHYMLTFLDKESGYITGYISDKQTHLPVSEATVILLDEHTNHEIGQTITNRKGMFLFPSKEGHHAISVFKEGFEPSGQIGYTKGVTIALEPGTDAIVAFWRMLLKNLTDILSLFFEFFLVTSLLLEIILFPAFGIYKTLPALLVSIFNIVLWIFFLREKGKQL